MTAPDRSATLDPRGLEAAVRVTCPHCGGGPWRHVRDLPNGSVIVQCRECKAATDLKEWEA